MARDDFFTADPTEKRFVDAHNVLFDKWEAGRITIAAARDVIEQQQQIIAAAEAEMAECFAKATNLRDAAALLGFDLMSVGQSAAEEMTVEQADTNGFSIKNFVLSRAMAAHPEPIRAATIRDMVRKMGHDIHDKTIGMSLYRWSQKGVLRREGKADWYYIPMAERAPGSAQDGFDDIA